MGGARSGKSTLAEAMLPADAAVEYVATGYVPEPGAGDGDWADRVARHRARRPTAWRTVETLDVAEILASTGPPVLVDCLTLWLTRVLDAVGAWQEEPGWAARAEERTGRLVAAWEATPRTVVAVVNDVGAGVVPGTAAGRIFRDMQGTLTARLAAAGDQVLHVVAGRAVEIPREAPRLPVWALSGGARSGDSR